MMTNQEKQKQLRKHKLWATGLFFLMASIFVITSLLLKRMPQEWMNYVRAFSEAAMVGALADWFAVTALFHYPMGLPIPHTNLIENSKQRIGDNLGNFVVDNFLTAENLRPYIVKLDLASFVAEWLQKDKNKSLLAAEATVYLRKIINDLDDDFIVEIIEKKGKEFIKTLKVNELLSNGLEYALDKGLHQDLLSFISGKLKMYIAEHEDMIRDRVKEESSSFIPGFVDNIIAKKITNGLIKYFGEIEANTAHPIRNDVLAQLKLVAIDIKNKESWKQDLERLRDDLLSGSQSQKLSFDLWHSVKLSLLNGLENEHSALQSYLKKSINDIALTFQNDPEFVFKVNAWIRKTVYRLVLKNKGSLGMLISSTVGNWQGRDLSEKLELEVGKDLQFIRINGTIVGGIVGLIIYAISHMLL